jgi:hypothetical protein
MASVLASDKEDVEEESSLNMQLGNKQGFRRGVPEENSIMPHLLNMQICKCYSYKA